MISSCMWLSLASCLEDQVFLIGPRCFLMDMSSLRAICISGLVVPALQGLHDIVQCRRVSPHKEKSRMGVQTAYTSGGIPEVCGAWPPGA